MVNVRTFAPQEIVTTTDVVEAAHFLHLLSPVLEPWTMNGGWSWTFRGHANAAWPLVPTVLRRSPTDSRPFWKRVAEDPSSALTRQFLAELPLGSDEDQTRALAEALLIVDFMHAADRAGMAIPDSNFLVQSWRGLAPIVGAPPSIALLAAIPPTGVKRWPPHELLATVALAQHYGVPTRLLDWTWRSKVAAYFAAAGVLNSDLEGGRLAVWALSRSWVETAWMLQKVEPDVEGVTAPQAGNPNLAAQTGTFTVARKAHEDIGLDVAMSVVPDGEFQLPDGRKGTTTDVLQAIHPKFTPLQRITLPHAQAPRLLELLALEGVSAATVFPGYQGVARSLEERRRFFPTKV